ncbi:A-agglutinin anchorage subunit-like [Haliotis rubra]|uniref:A-agglutinin anchorage subunit-like n=1 Tax=Haliotis rubra TaxID=36100 RepID=UPI001EE5538D|nr:A-agglutinin anchorage subunit-like [Haliotis rubra]
MEILPVILVLMLPAEHMFHADASVTVHTPDQQSYLPLGPLGVTVQERTSIRFNLTASNDAHVALYTPINGTVPMDIYEIVIGGWSNTKSVVRTRQQGRAKVSETHSALASSTAKPFWMSWSLGVIKVGSGTQVGVSTFMQYADSRYNVTAIAVMTAWGSTGDWVFEEGIISSSLLPSSTNLMMGTSLDTSYLEDTMSSDYTIYTSPMTIFSTTEINFTSAPQASSTLIQIFTNTDTHSTFLTVTSLSSSAFRVPSLVSTTNGITSTISSTAMADIHSASSLHGVTSLGSTYMDEITSLISPIEVISPLSSLHEVSTYMTDITAHLSVSVGVTRIPEETASSATTSSTTTFSSSSNRCRCNCRMALSPTSGEFKELVNAMAKKLSVPKHNLSSSLRKRKSVTDERPSSVGIGSGAVFLVVLPFAIVVLSDAQTLLCFLMNQRKR